MPFDSKRQARWMFANKPEMARTWAAHTPSMSALPEKKTKKHKKRAQVEDLGALFARELFNKSADDQGPPNYQPAPSPQSGCGACKNFAQGACSRYSVPVTPEMTCDTFEPAVTSIHLPPLPPMNPLLSSGSTMDTGSLLPDAQGTGIGAGLGKVAAGIKPEVLPISDWLTRITGGAKQTFQKHPLATGLGATAGIGSGLYLGGVGAGVLPQPSETGKSIKNLLDNYRPAYPSPITELPKQTIAPPSSSSADAATAAAAAAVEAPPSVPPAPPAEPHQEIPPTPNPLHNPWVQGGLGALGLGLGSYALWRTLDARKKRKHMEETGGLPYELKYGSWFDRRSYSQLAGLGTGIGLPTGLGLGHLLSRPGAPPDNNNQVAPPNSQPKVPPQAESNLVDLLTNPQPTLNKTSPQLTTKEPTALPQAPPPHPAPVKAPLTVAPPPHAPGSPPAPEQAPMPREVQSPQSSLWSDAIHNPWVQGSAGALGLYGLYRALSPADDDEDEHQHDKLGSLAGILPKSKKPALPPLPATSVTAGSPLPSVSPKPLLPDPKQQAQQTQPAPQPVQPDPNLGWDMSKGWYGGYFARQAAMAQNPQSQDSIRRQHPGGGVKVAEGQIPEGTVLTAAELGRRACQLSWVGDRAGAAQEKKGFQVEGAYPHGGYGKQAAEGMAAGEGDGERSRGEGRGSRSEGGGNGRDQEKQASRELGHFDPKPFQGHNAVGSLSDVSLSAHAQSVPMICGFLKACQDRSLPPVYSIGLLKQAALASPELAAELEWVKSAGPVGSVLKPLIQAEAKPALGAIERGAIPRPVPVPGVSPSVPRDIRFPELAPKAPPATPVSAAAPGVAVGTATPRPLPPPIPTGPPPIPPTASLGSGLGTAAAEAAPKVTAPAVAAAETAAKPTVWGTAQYAAGLPGRALSGTRSTLIEAGRRLSDVNPMSAVANRVGAPLRRLGEGTVGKPVTDALAWTGRNAVAKPLDMAFNLATGKGGLQSVMQGKFAPTIGYGAAAAALPQMGAAARGEAELPSMNKDMLQLFSGLRPLGSVTNMLGITEPGEASMKNPYTMVRDNVRDIGSVSGAMMPPFTSWQQRRMRNIGNEGVRAIEGVGDSMKSIAGIENDKSTIQKLNDEYAKLRGDDPVSTARRMEIEKQHKEISMNGALGGRIRDNAWTRTYAERGLEDPNVSPEEKAQMTRYLNKTPPITQTAIPTDDISGASTVAKPIGPDNPHRQQMAALEKQIQDTMSMVDDPHYGAAAKVKFQQLNQQYQQLKSQDAAMGAAGGPGAIGAQATPAFHPMSPPELQANEKTLNQYQSTFENLLPRAQAGTLTPDEVKQTKAMVSEFNNLAEKRLYHDLAVQTGAPIDPAKVKQGLESNDPNNPMTQKGVGEIEKEMQGRDPTGSVVADQALNVWSGMETWQKVLISAGMGMGLLGMMSMFMGEGGMMAPLAMLGGIGAAGYGMAGNMNNLMSGDFWKGVLGQGQTIKPDPKLALPTDDLYTQPEVAPMPRTPGQAPPMPPVAPPAAPIAPGGPAIPTGLTGAPAGKQTALPMGPDPTKPGLPWDPRSLRTSPEVKGLGTAIAAAKGNMYTVRDQVANFMVRNPQVLAGVRNVVSKKITDLDVIAVSNALNLPQGYADSLLRNFSAIEQKIQTMTRNPG